jgi:hypothetical protein
MKKLYVICDVNDADYITFESNYSEEKIKKLKNIENLSEEEQEELIEDLRIGSHQDMWPHTIKSYYVADIIEKCNIDFRMKDYN